MTISETRKLGIEFERRVQTMIPEKEYLDKLDTETIYAYLNSYLDKYIHDIYRNLDQIKSGSKMSAHVESILQEMLRTLTISVEDAKDYTGDITDTNGLVIVENGRSVTYPLDPSFYMYVRSVSNVTSTYSFRSNEPANGSQRPIRVIPNELVSQSDLWRILETPHNSLRILRYPAASIGAYESFGEADPEYTVKTDTVLEPNVPGNAISLSSKPKLINKKHYSIQDILDVFGPVYQPKTMGDQFDEDFILGYADDPIVFYVEPNLNSTLWRLVYSVLVDIEYMDKINLRGVPTLNVIYDQYTTPLGIKIVYYAQPQHFDLMTSTPCQLPMDAFDDLVTGAVDLYVQYVAGAEANKRRIQEAREKLNRDAERDSRRRRNQEDED